MKRIFSIIITIAFPGLFTGCDKYLDIEPSQQVSEKRALSTDENVKSVLIGAYSEFALPGIYGGCILRNSELLGGNGEIQWVGTDIGPLQIFNKTMIASNSEALAQWADSYEVINSVNNILSALSVVNEVDRDRVQGEALFLRGLMYFDLVRFFAQQYVFGEENTQPGVPLVLTPGSGITISDYVSRNTVEEVYNQVIADLTLAASLLPENNGVYATKEAANALLARVYLQKGDYADSRDASNAVISSGLYSLMTNYADEFNNDNNTAEDIFATQINTQDRISSMTEFFSIPEYGGGDGDIDILDGHLNLYSPGDTRRDLFFYGNGAMRSGKWNNEYGIVNLFRLAEMYLVRAECNTRLGTQAGATPLDDYNKVHTRAGLAAATSVTLDDIIFERRLELSFEGFRIHDIRRLHENVESYAWDDPKLVFPIPDREIQANPGLKDEQNPGY